MSSSRSMIAPIRRSVRPRLVVLAIGESATLFGLLIRSTERPSVAKRSRNSSATERTSVMNTSCRE
ncbi:MAG: hypothetical protein CAPSK01_001277 [Candidatus Accumulibacter vicinus]|uniref:Uncharacterized protein n=1 Tax=Candidatus Accumulibacter vicinus TaxID=2954382 RepID=A0A084Y2Z2_9PROT|nr:MAG: hypothetical protein CAPSK01_001277 [Candidatus Accumulibacter vicinus]